MQNISIFLAMMTLFSTCLCCAGDSQGQLQFRFKPGMRFLLVSASEQRTVAVEKGTEKVTQRNTRLESDFDVAEVEPDGSFWAKLTYRRAALKLKAPGVNVDFDSDANQTKIPVQALILRMMLGEEVYVNMTPQGCIKKINGLQAIVSSIKGRIPLITGRDELLQTVDKQFDEALVKSQFEDQMAVFPPSGQLNEPPRYIGLGQTWSRTSRAQGSSTETKRTFRLEERRPDGIDVIDVNFVYRTIADANETPAGDTVKTIGGVEVKRELSGTGKGRIEVDESTGRIINYTLTQDFVEQAKLSAQGPVLRLPPPPAPTTTHAVTTFEMIERPEAPPKVVPPKEPMPDNK